MVNTRSVLRTSVLSVLLLAGGLLAARAQSINPDPSLMDVFRTDANAPRGGTTDALGGLGYVQSFGLGVGFDASNPNSEFSNSATPQTAQTVWNTFVYRPLNGTDIAAGSSFQIGVHSFARGPGNAPSNTPVTIFASLFQLSGSLNGPNVPASTPVFQNIPILIDATGAFAGDHIFYSNKLNLANPIVNGNQYVLAFSPGPAGGATPADFGVVDRIGYPLTGQAPADQAIFQNVYLNDNNSGDTGGPFNFHLSNNTDNPTIAYRFFAAAPVPEPSSAVGLVVGLLCLLGFHLRTRRHAA